MRWQCLPFVFALPFLPWGCSRSESPSELHPLAGTVSRSGSPVTNGGFIFIPESSSPAGQVFNASVREDGSFSAQTLQTSGDGAVTKPGIPAGRYRVIYHPPSDGSKSGLEIELDEKVTVDASGRNKVIITLPDRLPEGLGQPRDDK